MRTLFFLTLSVMGASTTAAQLSTGDSLAVAQTIRRYHAALEAGDSAAIAGMLAPGAMMFERGAYAQLKGEVLAGQIRIARAFERTPGRIAVRILGWAAYAYQPALVQAKAHPELFKGREMQLIVLSRLGETWFIEAIHASTGSSEP